jgi:hypothetical protein
MTITSLAIGVLIAGLIVFVLSKRSSRKSAGLDEPGQMDDPQVRARIEKVAATSRASGKAAPAPQPDLPAVANQGLFPADQHVTGMPDDQPFGEDIQNPDSRTIPGKFHGAWKWENAGDYPADDARARAELIAADKINFGTGDEPVVAVRLISEDQIAVVTQAMDGGKWNYSLRYFGLSDDGAILTDLESADMKYVRG